MDISWCLMNNVFYCFAYIYGLVQSRLHFKYIIKMALVCFSDKETFSVSLIQGWSKPVNLIFQIFLIHDKDNNNNNNINNNNNNNNNYIGVVNKSSSWELKFQKLIIFYSYLFYKFTTFYNCFLKISR